MINIYLKAKRVVVSEGALIGLIIIVTLFTRFYHLTFESLWYDELYSVCNANPKNSIGLILNNLKTDFHPPLFYLLLHGVFNIFQYNDFTARAFVAVISAIGVWLVYLLGKEIKGKRTGLLSAFLLSIFFFHIKHSHEVRMYILLFALAILSSYYFLKYIKQAKVWHLVWYTLFTALSLYTHYYSFFILLGQGLCLFHLVIFKKVEVNIFKKFILSYLITIILYLLWISNIVATSKRKHFMDIPNLSYPFEYMYNFTGKEPITMLIFIVGIVFFLKNLFSKRLNPTSSGNLLLTYSFISVVFVSLIVSLFKPLINENSMIAVLPFAIIAVAIGLGSFKPRIQLILGAILFISNGINIAFVYKFYSKNTKQHFKQISRMIDLSIPENQPALVVSQIAIFYDYYFQQMNSKLELVNPHEHEPDSLLNGVDTFYIINAPFTQEKSKRLEEVDELGFLILNPHIKAKAKDIHTTHKAWVTYIDRNFEIDSAYVYDQREMEIAFRYKRR